MQKTVFTLFLLLLITACKYRSAQKTAVNVRTDSMIANYIMYTNNNPLRQNHQNNIAGQWVQDGTAYQDRTIYLVYKIGHDDADKDGKNKKFVMDERIYVDTAKRIVCTYDIFTGKLNEWKRQ